MRELKEVDFMHYFNETQAMMGGFFFQIILNNFKKFDKFYQEPVQEHASEYKGIKI